VNDAIETALGQRLVTIPSVPPIAWPNRDYDPKLPNAVPYLEFVHAPVQRVDDTIDASDPRQEGLALVTVIVPRGQFTSQANALADAVAARFSNGLRLALSTGGAVMMTKPADIVAGFADGVYWRVPVRIAYRTVA
jgi:hypothetical protein